MISVLLVDPCNLVRVGLRTVLAQTTDIRLLDEVSTGTNTIAAVAQHKPTTILLEPSSPIDNDAAFGRGIQETSPTSRILFFSAIIDPVALRATARGKTAGYLLKDADAEAVSQTIRLVADGHTYLDLTSPRKTGPAKTGKRC